MRRLVCRQVSSSAAAYLCEQGYVVIRGVANASELAHARELLWAFLAFNLTLTLTSDH